MKAKPRHVVERLARADVRPHPRRAEHSELGLGPTDLARALAGRELVLHYQPIVNVRGGGCRRVEALLRWAHPRLGLLLPGDFLALADPGLSAAISEWVITTARDQQRRWREQGQELGVSINLSRGELQQIEGLTAAAAGAGSGILTFEIGRDRGEAADIERAVLRLGATGATVALDDIGLADAPSASLAAMIDELKLARAIVNRAVEDPKARGELRVLMELARDYKLNVVAVGVEDRRTFDLIAQLGCDMAQGHWVSRPLIPDRLAPARRWAAGLALTGAVAFAANVGAGKAAAGGSDSERSLHQPGLFSSACCLDTPARDGDGLSVTERLAQASSRTGLPFSSRASARADLFIEGSLGSRLADDMAGTVDHDIAALEAEFGRTLQSRPAIYVFATRTSFALGLQQVFGVRATDAGVLAAANGGVALARQGAIAINLENVSARDLTVVRHELTHALVNEIIGEGTIPTWLHEGLARLQESRGVEDQFARARAAATARTLVGEGTTLASLDASSQWLQRNAQLGGGAYTVAGEAVRLLEQRVTRDGVLQILERVGRGESFGAAFSAVSGESLADYESAFPARLSAEQDDARIVQAAAPGGVRWSAVGFTPDRPITISIQGAAYSVEFQVTADARGMYEAIFGATAPKGDYIVRVTSPGRTATATLRT